jgi:large subunit ribosomal protein L22e
VKKAQLAKFYLDLKAPMADGIIEIGDFEKFLHDAIKVDGKKGNLGTKVVISKDKNRINIQAEMPFSKGYLKYLSKKYLKREDLRNFLRVVATTKAGFDFKYLAGGAANAED